MLMQRRMMNTFVCVLLATYLATSSLITTLSDVGFLRRHYCSIVLFYLLHDWLRMVHYECLVIGLALMQSLVMALEMMQLIGNATSMCYVDLSRGLSRGLFDSGSVPRPTYPPVPELLRLLIFTSETQDLWLTFPEPGDEQSVAYEKCYVAALWLLKQEP